jgi:hypothetical protein
MRRLLLALGFAAALAQPAAAQYPAGPTNQSSLALIAPTVASPTDSSNRIATTAWVNSLIASGLTLASGKIWIGSAGNIATPQTPSGDCTLALSGVITCTQAAGNFQVIGNLTVGGSIIDGNGILATNIVAPATPAAGTTRIYVDSTTKTLSAKNDAGTVSNTVVASTAVANQFMTGISGAGVITRAQPAVTDLSGLGTGVATALGVNIGSAGAPVLFNGAGGTPSSLTLTNATGLPVGSITGLGAGCATWLATASSANLRGCVTDETGTGLLYFQGGDIGTPSAGVGTNLTALNASNLGSGTVAAARMPALTGDATSTVGTVATTVTKINAVDQTVAWTNYTPTITSSGGAFTTATANGYYRQIGKTVCVRVTSTQTTLGPASGTLQVSLPFNASANVFGQLFLAVNVVSGVSGNAQVGANSATMNIFKYDGTTVIGAGNIINVQGCYESV